MFQSYNNKFKFEYIRNISIHTQVVRRKGKKHQNNRADLCQEVGGSNVNKLT